jgi:small-conductance mechanosensitive channel
VLRLCALALALLAVTGGAAPAAAQGGDTEIPMAPVEIDGVTLFHVRGASSLPAPQRAAAIRQRIIATAEDPNVTPESIRTATVDGIVRVVAAERVLMGVVDADAAIEQVNSTDLALTHAQRIRQAIVEYRNSRTPAALERKAINIIVATVALLAAIVIVWWGTRRADRFFTRRWEARIKTVGIQSFEVMRADRIAGALHSVIAAVRAGSIVIILLLYVGYVLGQLPWTHGLASNMFSFALAPLRVIGGGIVAQIPSLVFLAVLFVVVRIVLRLTRLFFDAVGRGTVTLDNFDREWAAPTYKIVRILIVAFGLIVAYPYIPGSGSAAFQGVSLFIGVVFSLGSSSAIANIVAGYMMTYRRAFKVGDRIRVGDSYGEVIEARLQVTHLRTPKNVELVLPNSHLLGAEVMNYSSLSRSSGLILHTEVGIGYETPWRQVEAMLTMAADRTAGLAREPRPFVLEKKLGDFAITYELNVHTNNVPHMAQLYAELHRQILDVFNEYGVQIMTPAYEGDPEVPKVVTRKDWHTAPASALNADETTAAPAGLA